MQRGGQRGGSAQPRATFPCAASRMFAAVRHPQKLSVPARLAQGRLAPTLAHAAVPSLTPHHRPVDRNKSFDHLITAPSPTILPHPPTTTHHHLPPLRRALQEQTIPRESLQTLESRSENVGRWPGLWHTKCGDRKHSESRCKEQGGHALTLDNRLSPGTRVSTSSPTRFPTALHRKLHPAPMQVVDQVRTGC